MPTSTFDLTQRVKARALEVGFTSVGIADPAQVDVTDALKRMIANGWHGQMGWLEDRLPWRANPQTLWPEVRSVVMMTESYAPESDPLDDLKHPTRAAISAYAKGRDYHDVVKKRLKRLARWIVAETGAEVKVFVDTAPVPEKPLAQVAGLGWQGKHTNLVSRETGNWVFLGAVYTTAQLAPDAPEIDHCGSCRKCLDICPTEAFPAPYQLDARRCISYLTIEHRGPIDPELRPLLGNRIYGCDDCLAVCPWNKFATSAADIRYAASSKTDRPRLVELMALDDAAFRQRFSGSAIKRIGRDRFVRNCLYAAGNAKDPDLKSSIEPLKQDGDPVVRDAAIWADKQLSDPR